MSTDNIITIISSAASLISILGYFWIFQKINKKGAAQTFENILNKMPEYINTTRNMMPGANKLQLTNCVLAMIKSECEEANVKYKEKQAKKAVEEQL